MSHVLIGIAPRAGQELSYYRNQATMAVVTAHIIRRCVCGSTVAYVESSRGKLYPVDIHGTVTQYKLGSDTAVVKNNDFHHCAYYPGLADFLLRAIERSKAKRLRIRLLTSENEPVLLSWAGKAFANITDGQPAHATYYGSVNLDGGGFRAADDGPRGLLDLLTALDRRPADAARAYGEATGQCCFCDRPLDDERSITVGYGKRCATRYGLPWGDAGENSTRRAKRTREAIRRDDQ